MVAKTYLIYGMSQILWSLHMYIAHLNDEHWVTITLIDVYGLVQAKRTRLQWICFILQKPIYICVDMLEITLAEQ